MQSRPVDYEALVRSPFFVDKSALISGLEGGRLNMIFRPSGYFKTSALAMLKLFYGSPAHRSMFQTLAIGKNEKAMVQQGRHHVISLDFTDFVARDWSSAVRYFQAKMSAVYHEFSDIFMRGRLCTRHLDDGNYYKKMMNPEELNGFAEALVVESLGRLIGYFRKIILFKKELIVLIDGFDKPWERARECGYDDRMVGFMALFYHWVNGDCLMHGLHRAVAMGSHYDRQGLSGNSYCYVSDLSWFGVQNTLNRVGLTEEDIEVLVTRHQLPRSLINTILTSPKNAVLYPQVGKGITVIDPVNAMNMLSSQLGYKLQLSGLMRLGVFPSMSGEAEAGQPLIHNSNKPGF